MCKGVTHDPITSILQIGIQIDVFLTASLCYFFCFKIIRFVSLGIIAEILLCHAKCIFIVTLNRS